MSKYNGTYKIIDLDYIDLKTSDTIPNLYEQLENTNLPILLEHIVIDNKEYDNLFINCYVSDSDYIIELYGFKLVIDSENNISLTELDEREIPVIELGMEIPKSSTQTPKLYIDDETLALIEKYYNENKIFLIKTPSMHYLINSIKNVSSYYYLKFSNDLVVTSLGRNEENVTSLQEKEIRIEKETKALYFIDIDTVLTLLNFRGLNFYTTEYTRLNSFDLSSLTVGGSDSKQVYTSQFRYLNKLGCRYYLIVKLTTEYLKKYHFDENATASEEVFLHTISKRNEAGNIILEALESKADDGSYLYAEIVKSTNTAEIYLKEHTTN